MSDVSGRIRINGHDVFVFLAGKDQFCNVTQLADAFGRPDVSFERYLASGHGSSFVESLAQSLGVTTDRLHFRRADDGYWATHMVALDFAGWTSPHLRALYYRAVQEWAADKISGMASYADDPIIAMRVKQIEMERRVEAQEQRIDVLDERSAAAARQAAITADTVNGHHGFYALAPWAAKEAAIHMDEREAAREAVNVLVPMCARRGIKPRKVDSSKYRHVNAYPEEVLREWAEDYRRRIPRIAAQFPWETTEGRSR